MLSEGTNMMGNDHKEKKTRRGWERSKDLLNMVKNNI